MKIDIIVPSFGESVVEATIGMILSPTGSSVKMDQEILELETDKLNQVLHAPSHGQITLHVKTGDVVKVGQVIGFIEATQGSSVQTPNIAHPQPPLVIKGEQRRVKMTKLRKVIAERLVQVKNETAMLTTFNEVDLSVVIAAREKVQEAFLKKYGVKLGFMSFFIKASVAALQEFPAINGRIEGDEIVYNNTYDISVAVSTEKGLMVPVIRGADAMSYGEIEKELKTLAEKARSGNLSMDDLQGGTFTITNAGVFGSLLSTPILNPPQSGILGMHNIVKRPIAIDDQVVIRPMMYIALSYDHRIVDGKEAVSFLMHVKKHLENFSIVPKQPEELGF